MPYPHSLISQSITIIPTSGLTLNQLVVGPNPSASNSSEIYILFLNVQPGYD